MDLGQLNRIDPRGIWKHEAHDFTPWLAENIETLGGLLGLELEVVEREADVGDFSLDILARDLGRDRAVVIENQLTATDHSHLGQLLTYAAGLDAGVVVWVSPEFRDEHRRAVDWLNRSAGANTEYFAVVVEVLRIDDSRPAVNLRLVASPSEFARSARPVASAEGTSSLREAYRQFFQALIDELREKYKFTNAKAGQPQNWYSFSAGVAGFTFGMSFAATGELRGELYIDLKDKDRNKAVFDALWSDRVAIEAAFGESLRWERLEDRRACRVASYAPGSIDDAADILETHRKWAVERLLRFEKVFGPRLKHLALATAASAGG